MARENMVAARRRLVAGAGELAFILGICVGIGVLGIFYYKVIAKESPPRRPVDVSIDFSRQQAPKPQADPTERPILPNDSTSRSYAQQPPVNIGDPNVLGGETRPADAGFATTTHDTILEAPVDTSPYRKKPKPAAAADDEGEPKPDVRPEVVKRIDHVRKATKFEYYYAWGYGLSFMDVPDSYYTEVILESFRNSKWSYDSGTWRKFSPRAHAVTTTGKTIGCYQIWPIDETNHSSTLIYMLFLTPNDTTLREVGIDSESWPVKKVMDSGR